MLSNIAMIRGIYRNEFKCMYLKNQKNFVEFLLYFWVYIKFWIFWKKKKIESYSLIISEIIHSKKCAYLNA